jgi:hypothetical protein
MLINYSLFTETLLVLNNGRVPHVEMGSNRVCTMRVRGEANVRDTALVFQLNTHSVLFCRFSALSSSAEFCRMLQNSAEILDFR